MSLGKRVVSSSEALIDRVLCVIGAVFFSQAPEFMQQYAQRLGGHLDEARRTLGQYEDIAHHAGITLDSYIARTNAAPDLAVAKLGGVMEGTVNRVAELTLASTSLHDASMFKRPFVFLRHLDTQIAQSTWAAYKPAVPTTAEGLVYALIGIGVFLGIYYGCVHAPLARMYRKRREAKLAERAAD